MEYDIKDGHGVNGVDIENDTGYCRSIKRDKELLKTIKKCKYFISYDKKKRVVSCKRTYQARISSCKGCKYSALFEGFAFDKKIKKAKGA